MESRVEQLVRALADSRVDTAIREVCRGLLRKWEEEDTIDYIDGLEAREPNR